MNPKPAERIHPFPTKKDVASSIGCLFVIGCIFALPVILFFFVEGPVLVFLVWLFPIILLLFLGQKIFGEFEAFRNRHRFSEYSLTTNAKVIDHIWIKGQSDPDLYQVVVEFEANTVSKGMYLQRLKFDVPVVLYDKVGERIDVRYSRLNPRIALLEGEEGSNQMIDARQYPGEFYGEYFSGEYNAAIVAFGLFSLIGIGLLIFDKELIGKIVGMVVIVFCWSIVGYLITMDSRARRKRKQEMDEFMKTNVSTRVKVVSIAPSLSQLTIQFTVSNRTASPIQMTLVVKTDNSKIKIWKKDDYIMVRYSPSNPRIALIEGEF